MFGRTKKIMKPDGIDKEATIKLILDQIWKRTLMIREILDICRDKRDENNEKSTREDY